LEAGANNSRGFRHAPVSTRRRPVRISPARLHSPVMSRALPYLLVGAGGFAGAIARFLVGQWMSGLAASRFPLATFLINVSGSFLLGVVAAMTAARAFANSDAVALAAGVGFLGAYTTFSTFELETHALLQDRLSLTA